MANAINTYWINATLSDEELRRQHLTWAASPINRDSVEGKVFVPLLENEMERRKLKPILPKESAIEGEQKLIEKIAALGLGKEVEL